MIFHTFPKASYICFHKYLRHLSLGNVSLPVTTGKSQQVASESEVNLRLAVHTGGWWKWQALACCRMASAGSRLCPLPPTPCLLSVIPGCSSCTLWGSCLARRSLVPKGHVQRNEGAWSTNLKIKESLKQTATCTELSQPSLLVCMSPCFLKEMLVNMHTDTHSHGRVHT